GADTMPALVVIVTNSLAIRIHLCAGLSIWTITSRSQYMWVWFLSLGYHQYRDHRLWWHSRLGYFADGLVQLPCGVKDFSV
ncbi:hypothetical protein, partial [Thiothrix lacustris]|uniref:hypothetical protein n=1 Tax=Thiothrix lacustris TaxID=525917 RepID=UPI001B8093E6